MKATIVLLTTSLDRGGAETQVVRLAIGLRDRGWRTRVVSLLAPGALGRPLAEAGIPVESLAMKPGSADPRGGFRLAAILREWRPQVLHCHLFHANLLGRAIRLFCPVPVVISTLHSLAESGRDSADIRFRDRAYCLTGALANATVAVSEAVAERHAAARAVTRRNLRVIPNGVDTSVFRPREERRALREQFGLGREFAWLTAGRLMWKKDYRTLLRAFASVREGVLLIAGTGPQEDELRALALELGANVRFLGERDDVAGLMAVCDAFVLSSIVEGLPMTLLEAAASGLVCVTTDAGGARDAVLDGRTGFVIPPGDADPLAGAMLRVMRSPAEERACMGRAAREHAVNRFDIERVLSQWEDLYRELLAASQP